MPGWSSLEHFLLQYPMFGLKPVAKQETRMTTSYYIEFHLFKGFFDTVSISCEGGNERVQKEGLQWLVSLLVLWKTQSQSVTNGKITKKMIDLEICLHLNWPMTNEPQLSAKHCSQLAAYFGHTLGCRILSSFMLTHFTLTFKSE